MTPIRKVLLLISLFLVFETIYSALNPNIDNAFKRIFLTNKINCSQSDALFKLGMESFEILKDIKNERALNEREHFSKNFGKFILNLYVELQGNDFDIYMLFSKVNEFLKGYDFADTKLQNAAEFNKTEFRAKAYDILYAVEHNLNHSTVFEGYKHSNLSKSDFNALYRKKMKSSSDLGYFFLEFFATLVGITWGIISTTMYLANPMSMFPKL